MAFRFPFSFPPQGPLLVLLAALYLLPGLAGHDPWKPEDATAFGVVFAMVHDGHWLLPHLAGDPWFAAPLYYWMGGLFAHAFGWLLPLHDAARLASGACGALFLLAAGNAAAELYGAASRRTAVMLAIGCLGLFVHIHEAQPGLATLAAFAGTCWGVTLLPRLPLWGGAIAGLSIAGAFLAGGLPGLFLAIPLPLLPALVPAWRTGPVARGALLALAVGSLLAALWPLAIAQADPAFAAQWWLRQRGAFGQFLHDPAALLKNLAGYLNILSWYAWPALPLALWALWRNRRGLARPDMLLPLAILGIALLVLAARFDARSAVALPLLLPVVLLATPGAGTLRRGAANAFDWFGMMTFSVAMLVVWLGWVAMVFGVPPRIAANIARLEPGFAMQVFPLSVSMAVLLSLGWAWLIFSSPRSPLRGTTHWAAGMACLWALGIALWLPALDYAKTYRPVSEALARHLPPGTGCIASRGLGASQRASFHYFSGIITKRERGETLTTRCNTLLIQGTAHASEAPPASEWKLVWEGHRASDRDERYRLYRRIQP